MATKVIILGEQAEQKKQLKKIEFVKCMSKDYIICNALYEATNWVNIELICKNYGGHKEDMDLMFAYDEDRSKGTLYMGHFNDGVV